MRSAAFGTVIGLALSGSILSAAQPADATRLATALQSSNAAEKHAAADALADLGSAARTAVPQLVAALTSSDAELRWRAARALGVIGDAQSVPALRKQAGDPEVLVRAQVIFALGRLKASDADSLATIVAHLTDADAQVRRASVRALRMIEAPRQITTPLIVKLLNDTDPAVAMRALHTIAEGGVEMVPALTSALEQKEARYWACLALAEIGAQAKAAVPALVNVLADERPEVRLQAAVALGEIGAEAKPAAGALVKLMEDKFDGVRVATVYALGRIGDLSAANALTKAEQSTDPFQRMLATWALAKLHPADAQRQQLALGMLVTGLADKNRDIAHMAARALEELKPDANAVRPLVDKVIAANPDATDRVLQAFASLGARAVPHAIEALKDPQRRVRALSVLARIGPEAAPAVPQLTELLKNGDAATKTETLHALAAIGPAAAPAVPAMTEALASSDAQAVITAAYALGQVGSAAHEAVPALKKLSGSDNELARLTAVWALLKVGPANDEMVKQAVPMLTAALRNEREFVRIQAAMTLGDLGPQASGALPALQAATADGSPAVRSAAEAAIKKIKG